ncbi:MAG: hypothetical protein WBP34_03800, partial [Thermoanaerobaculia bacterium]
GYLTLPAGAEVPDDEADFFDWEWLDSQLAATETDHLRHLHFEQPLTIVLDGREGRGLIAKPKSQP